MSRPITELLALYKTSSLCDDDHFSSFFERYDVELRRLASLEHDEAEPSKSEEADERVHCTACGKKEAVKAAYADDRSWVQSPPGWFCTDSYPPGDMGTLWACSPECLTQMEGKTRM